jgi:hypothetical protein
LSAAFGSDRAPKQVPALPNLEPSATYSRLDKDVEGRDKLLRFQARRDIQIFAPQIDTVSSATVPASGLITRNHRGSILSLETVVFRWLI